MGKRGSADAAPGTPLRKLRRATSGASDASAPTPNTRTLRAVERYKQKYGHSPSQKSNDPEERRLANKYSHVPRHRKKSLNAAYQRTQVEETLRACVAFLEANGSAPQRTEDPARAEEDKLAQRLFRGRTDK